jgi:hypothetical protein
MIIYLIMIYKLFAFEETTSVLRVTKENNYQHQLKLSLNSDKFKNKKKYLTLYVNLAPDET